MIPRYAAILALAFAGSIPALAEPPVPSLESAVDAARALAASGHPFTAVSAAPIAHCPDAKALETPFEMTVVFDGSRQPLELKFTYADCQEEGRNDYLPPYTTRSYKGTDGYTLVVVTDEGATESTVLLAKGNEWAGRFAQFDNAVLVSGNPVAVGGVTVKDAAGEAKGRATLREASHRIYPQLKICETADWSAASANGAPTMTAKDKPLTGWDGRGTTSLVLLTRHAAFYYHEDCDICAEVTRCDLTTGALTSIKAAHQVDCGDLKPYAANAVYDACKP